MRALRVIVSMIFIVVLGACVFFHFTKSTDTTKPVIRCDTNVIEVSVNDGNDALLKHIKAVDAKDGDLSDEVIVEKSSAFIDFGKVNITFSVSDNDNNVSKISVPVVYTDYQNPRFELKDDLVFKTETKPNIEDCIKVTDSFDGDISDRLVVISNGADPDINGKYPLTLKITNSKSYTYTMNVDLIMTDKFTAGYSIELENYLIYKKIGEEVDYESLIKSVANPLRSTEGYNIDIDSSDVDNTKAGIYNVMYYQKSGGQTKAVTRLIVCYED